MPPRNLHDLLTGRRAQLINRWTDRIRATLSETGMLSRSEIVDHVPSFIDELVATLSIGTLPGNGGSAIAREHGVQRFALGFNISQVIREYGTLVECIVRMASEEALPIDNAEFIHLSTYVTAGIADAISQYTWQRDQELQRQSAEHIGFIAHELRNPLATARLALGMLRTHELKDGGRVTDMLDRSLVRESELIDTAMTQAFLKAGATARRDRLAVPALLKEVVDEAALEAEHRAIVLSVEAEPDMVVQGDRRMLRSALTNLLQNALKFTAKGGSVIVRAKDGEGCALIEVEDRCGGLPSGPPEQLFQTFVQKGEDRSGAGLGLAIVKQAIEAHGGTIKVRDLPHKGCVFSIELPRI